jgi:hypothetical protein
VIEIFEQGPAAQIPVVEKLSQYDTNEGHDNPCERLRADQLTPRERCDVQAFAGTQAARCVSGAREPPTWQSLCRLRLGPIGRNPYAFPASRVMARLCVCPSERELGSG